MNLALAAFVIAKSLCSGSNAHSRASRELWGPCLEASYPLVNKVFPRFPAGCSFPWQAGFPAPITQPILTKLLLRQPRL